MTIGGLVLQCGIVAFLGLAACQNRAFQTVVIYDSPSRFVRLEVDPTADANRGHSHPSSLTSGEIAAILSGLMIEQPARLMDLLGKNQESSNHPAFTTAEVGFFAPLLAKGLGTATSEEIITFYESRQETAIVRKVTSGGIFIDGDELHLVLGNYRSPTHYASDPGTDDTFDDRLTPMRSIAPQETRLYFEPVRAVASPKQGALKNLLQTDRQEVVVLFKQLAPAKAGAGRESDHGRLKTGENPSQGTPVPAPR